LSNFEEKNFSFSSLIALAAIDDFRRKQNRTQPERHLSLLREYFALSFLFFFLQIKCEEKFKLFFFLLESEILIKIDETPLCILVILHTIDE
jgi:hypothetical protein